jgi:hypothetical protein
MRGVNYLRDILDGLPESTEYDIDGRPATRAEFEAAHEAALTCARRGGWPSTLEILDPRGEFLRGRSKSVFSQFGEDGLIAAAFEKIGTRNRWCFEVGAGDGISLSNTKVLRDAGWGAVLIEADAGEYARMQKQLWDPTLSPVPPVRLHMLQARIGPQDLDLFLSRYGLPSDLDLGVIDVDGQDYHVFEGLKLFRPRVLLVEFNMQDAPVPPLNGDGQAGLTAILALGKEKRYVALARTNVNVLFVAEEALGKD